MPSDAVKAYADEAGVPTSKVEGYWEQAKEQAEKKGLTGDEKWAYVNGAVRKILKLEALEDLQHGLPVTDIIEEKVASDRALQRLRADAEKTLRGDRRTDTEERELVHRQPGSTDNVVGAERGEGS